MNWVNGMNQAVDYIERNLSGEIDPAKAAQLAACSEFHFQRMFAFISGVTLSEYIRRRRMTAAAFELSNGARVLELALKYGYESPTAFNRAFRSVHGVSPTQSKREGIRLTAYPRITFTVSIKGEEAMNYKIVKKEPIRIVGYVTHEQMTMEDCFEKVPAFWQSVAAQGGMEKLCALMDGSEPAGILGVSTCDNGEYSGYWIAVASGKPAPDGMEAVVLPETTYAVFECVGPAPETIQSVQQRIISEWLPTSDYEYAPAPDIEVYSEGDQRGDDYYSEVWLPIVKK